MPRRSIVALAGAAALLVAAAAPAAAEPATGNVDRTANKIGFQINVGDGWLATIPTNLIGFSLDDGTKLGVYCVEIETDIDDEHTMVEHPWDDYPNASSPFHDNRARINWVLHHGYPATSLEALAAALPTPPHDGLDELEAIAATQAAVWHYSDGVDLNRDDPLSGDASDAKDAEDALAIYDYLTGAANTGIAEPAPALSVTPATLSGTAGERIGPFTVTTTGTVELTPDLPEGVTLTDAAGTPVTTAVDGAELYVNVPAGAAKDNGSFELATTARIDTGRLFVGKNYDKHPTQSLIVATSGKTTLTASAKVDWTPGTTTTTTQPPTTTTTTTEAPPTTTTTSATPAPQPKNDTDNLADTGASIFTPILLGLVLVGAGLGALLVVRRRKNA